MTRAETASGRGLRCRRQFVLRSPACARLPAAAPPHPTYDDVASSHELEPGLDEQHVAKVDDVAHQVHQEPVARVVRCLAGEDEAHRDEPAVPVVGSGDDGEPQEVEWI